MTYTSQTPDDTVCEQSTLEALDGTVYPMLYDLMDEFTIQQEYHTHCKMSYEHNSTIKTVCFNTELMVIDIYHNMNAQHTIRNQCILPFSTMCDA